INSRLAPRLGKIRAIAHQPSGHDHLSKGIDCRNSITSRECNYLLALLEEERIGVDKQSAHFSFNSCGKGGFGLSFATGLKYLKGPPQGRRRGLQFLSVRSGIWIVGINQKGEPCIFRHRLAHQFEPLGTKYVHEIAYAGDVSSRPVETCNQTDLYRVLPDHENNRDCVG